MCPLTSRTLHCTPEALSKYSPGRKPGCSSSSNLSPHKRSAGDPFDLPFALAADRTGQACEAATRWSAITIRTPGHQELKERPRDPPDWLAYLLWGSARKRKDRVARAPRFSSRWAPPCHLPLPPLHPGLSASFTRPAPPEPSGISCLEEPPLWALQRGPTAPSTPPDFRFCFWQEPIFIFTYLSVCFSL